MSKYKKRIEYVLKHNRSIQFLYKHGMSIVFKTMGLFIKTDDALVLFNSFGGRKFNDSPKVLFEAMLQDERFRSCSFVWAFEEPGKFNIPNAKTIRIDSLEYFITALKAKVWISSVNIERGLHIKERNTIYLNTWHGAGTKKIGNACNGRKDYNFSNVDMMLVQSDFERDIFIRDFRCNPKAIRMIGFPRNDELFHLTNDKKEDLKKRFQIPLNKKVILYAPTWRDSRDGGLSYEFNPPINMNKWKSKFADHFVMLFRMHTFTTSFDMKYDEFAINVSDYENLNHVLAITDVLITDYSTIVYDAAIANIPFICFGFDYQVYSKERGFYYDLDAVYPGGVFKTEDEVIKRIPSVIKGMDQEKYAAFREQFIQAGGSATEKILFELANKLGR